MPHYIYRARNGQGELIRGSVEAAHLEEAIERLRGQGLLVTAIELNKDILLYFKELLKARARVRLKELASFCRQFATLLGAGVPILTALTLLMRQSRDKHFRTVLLQVIQDLEAGETLTAALTHQGNYFPPLMVNMVAAGEVGGILEEVFDRLGDHFEKEDAIYQKVRSALTYPAVVLSVAFLVVFFLVTFVVPVFVDLLTQAGAQLPLPTRILLATSGFVRHYWYLLVTGGLILATGFGRLLQRQDMRLIVDALTLRLPLIGDMVRKYTLARFSRTLGVLLRSGVPILTALDVVQKATGNMVIIAALQSAQHKIRDGQSMVGPLADSKVFPPLVLEMIQVGEETGALDVMLLKVAEFYEKEVERQVGGLTSILEPVMIVIMGLIVGFIVVSLVMPMFDIFGTIKA